MVKFNMYLKYILFVIVVYIIYKILITPLNYNIYTVQWWNPNDGKKYNDIFNFTDLAYFMDFPIFYTFRKQFGITTVDLNKDKARFLFQMIVGNAAV